MGDIPSSCFKKASISSTDFRALRRGWRREKCFGSGRFLGFVTFSFGLVVLSSSSDGGVEGGWVDVDVAIGSSSNAEREDFVREGRLGVALSALQEEVVEKKRWSSGRRV